MIVIIGDAVVDLVALGLQTLPDWGEDREVETISRHPGGSALHVATNMAALGAEVALLAGVGEDEWATYLTSSARAYGVETAGVVPLNSPTAVTMVLSGPTDRAFVSLYGATATFGPNHLDRELLAGAKHVHFSGYYQSHALRPALPALFESLRARGVTTSLDTGTDPDDAYGAPLPELLRHVDLFLPNESEATAISGESDAEAALEALTATIPLVVVKLGARGAIAGQGEDRWYAAAYPADVVDTTGAGDAFAAAFLFRWCAGRSIPDALRMANAAGSLAVRRPGAGGAIPYESELAEVIAQSVDAAG